MTTPLPPATTSLIPDTLLHQLPSNVRAFVHGLQDLALPNGWTMASYQVRDGSVTCNLEHPQLDHTLQLDLRATGGWQCRLASGLTSTAQEAVDTVHTIATAFTQQPTATAPAPVADPPVCEWCAGSGWEEYPNINTDDPDPGAACPECNGTGTAPVADPPTVEGQIPTADEIRRALAAASDDEGFIRTSWEELVGIIGYHRSTDATHAPVADPPTNQQENDR